MKILQNYYIRYCYKIIENIELITKLSTINLFIFLLTIYGTCVLLGVLLLFGSIFTVIFIKKNIMFYFAFLISFRI